MATTNLLQQSGRPTISTEQWSPEEDTSPNPWYDVANFLPKLDQVDVSQEGDGFRLMSLPIELIYHIAKFLPRESAIALALTSRPLYSILGSGSFASLDAGQHWRLLLLLERDTDMFVACQECQILHSPCAPLARNANQSTDNMSPMACLREKRCLLPEGVTPALCRLVAKRYIRHQPYGDLLTMAGRTKRFTLPDFKLFDTTEMRMIEGNLYVREEILVAPLTTNGDLTSRSAFLLDEITNGFRSHQICRHWRWEFLGLHLSYDRKSVGDPYRNKHARYHAFVTDERFATGHAKGVENDSLLGVIFDCNGSHGSRCYDCAPISRAVLDEALAPALRCAVLHPQPCREAVCDKLRASYRVNVVRVCQECATDICFSAQDVEGIGRVIGLTTWKKLGGVYEGQPSAWLAHCEGVIVPDQGTELRKAAAVYTTFDHTRPLASSEVTPVCSYMPSLGRRVRSLFTQAPKVSEEDWASCIPEWNWEGHY